MKKIINTPYLSVSLDSETALTHFTWTEKAKFMTDQEFREHLREFTKKIAEYRIKKALVDSRLGHFVLSVEMQVWHDQEIVPFYIEHGFKKIAFLMPEDLFEALSLEQTFEEKEAQKLDVQYFTDYEMALAWIKI